jgi:GMP synthase (glutamine-hydrolysing)
MIVYVDLEHDRLQNKPELWQESLARRLQIKYRLEDISGDRCLIVRYLHLSPALLYRLNVQAVAISGCHTDFEHYNEESLAGLRVVYREAAWPILGFCAGHQLMAQAYGAEIGPMGPLPPDTPSPHNGSHRPGMQEERGVMPVRVHTSHPLIDNLPQQPTFFQSHYWEVKSLPTGFETLAASDLSPIQAIAHAELPIFGVQFHAEQYDEAHPDGRQILENFFTLAAVSKPERVREAV